MTSPADILVETPMAAVFGAVGLAGQLGWPLAKSREWILRIQLCAATAYATQYALLDQETGAAVCLVGAMQTTVALIAGDRPWLKRMGFGFIPLVLVIGWLTWGGFPTLLAVSACCLVMVGRMQRDTLRMRGVLLAAAPVGLSYDFAVGAVPALIGACVSLSVAAMAFRREWNSRRRSAAVV